jgi:hypothetical protein
MRDEFDALEANRLAPLAPLDHGEGGAGFPPRVETGTKERGCGLRRTQSSNQKYRVQKHPRVGVVRSCMSIHSDVHPPEPVGGGDRVVEAPPTPPGQKEPS